MTRGSAARRTVLALVTFALFTATLPWVASAENYSPISGEGSSWAGNAIAAMAVNVADHGMDVEYNPTGSTAGRKSFLDGTVDFAASDIPFQFHPEDGSAPENPAPGSYAYIPVVAGGTAFMYNLNINGQQVTNLRLSGENVAKIFTGVITMWNDPALQADNPGLVLPARTIVPIVRSDGSGSSAQFTMWMIDRHPAIWNSYCERVGRAGKCGFTSLYPTISGMIAKRGDDGIAGYVADPAFEGTIGYVNYSYAMGNSFPVAKVLNAAGYYTEPTPENVAVSLLQADVNTDESDPSVYLTQKLEGVYADTDPRNYQLSSYSYFILPTTVRGQFDIGKGKTLGAFAYHAMCEAQAQSASLGYSPMPINLVEASLEQIRKIPGVEVQNINVESCNNPTFSPDGRNLLAEQAPMPLPCDRQGIPTQCEFGTGGMPDATTTVSGGGSSYNPQNPGGENPQNPGGENPQNPGGENPQNPGGENPQNPGGENPQNSAGQDTQNEGGADPQNPDGGGEGGSDAAAGASSSTNTTAPCTSTSTTSTPTTSTPTTSTSTTNTPTDGSSSSSSSTSVTDSSTTTSTQPCDSMPMTANPASAAGADEVCDADTGVCGPPSASVVGVDDAMSAEGGAMDRAADPARPTTIDADTGWSVAQTLMLVVVIVLAIAVIVVPAVAWRHLTSRAAAS